MKTEPTTYSVDDLANESDLTTCWEGVRNYQARNLLRDEIEEGDRVLFYHSACKTPAVVGLATVARGGYPDHHAWDKKSHYFDPKSDPESPTWFMVDVKLDQKLERPVTLAELREEATRARSPLSDMVLLQKGSRLSVQPVTKKQFDRVVKMSQS
ncbi:EVE domain-containing protein [Rhodopirellula halodulae]|nr:EVE domain-containing protein [Rhodopirellula sp. JC740]